MSLDAAPCAAQNQSRIVSSDGLSRLYRAMQTFPGNSNVLFVACSALAKLSADLDAVRERVMATGGMARVLVGRLTVSPSLPLIFRYHAVLPALSTASRSHACTRCFDLLAPGHHASEPDRRGYPKWCG